MKLIELEHDFFAVFLCFLEDKRSDFRTRLGPGVGEFLFYLLFMNNFVFFGGFAGVIFL